MLGWLGVRTPEKLVVSLMEIALKVKRSLVRGHKAKGRGERTGGIWSLFGGLVYGVSFEAGDLGEFPETGGLGC